MKKVLSIVLSIVMVLCMMPAMAFADTADTFSDAADIEYAEAVDVLYAAGIIDGMPDGSFVPNGNVTREQAAKLIATVLLGDKAEKLATEDAPFTDVAADRWSAGYIAYGVEKGILAGVGNGAFNPTGNVTALQLAKMLLVVAGYDANIEGLTGDKWGVNTSVLAEENDLFAGNDAVLVNNAATREEAALYILNTLVADMVKYGNKGTNITLADGTKVVVGADPAEKVATETTDAAIGYDMVQQVAEKYVPDLTLETAAAADNFGRPANKWTYDTTEVGVYASKTPVLTYTTAIKEKTLFADLGVAGYAPTVCTDSAVKHVHADVYVDGAAASPASIVVDKASTTDIAVSGEGTTLEVYKIDTNEYRLVAINEYVATVGTPVKADANTGAARYIPLTATGASVAVNGKNFDTDSFAKDDVVLVTMSGTDVVSVKLAEKVENVAVTGYNETEGTVTFNGVAHKFSAMGTSDTTFDMSATATYTFYLDSQGNVIASKPYSATITDYVIPVLVDTEDLGNNVEGKYNLVKFVDLEGKATTVKVASSASITTAAWYTVKADANNADLTVFTPASNAAVTYTTTTTAGITKSEPVIGGIKTNNDTKFVLKTATSPAAKWTVYTGISNLPTYTIASPGALNVVAVVGTADSFADAVYIDVTGATADVAESTDVIYIKTTSAAVSYDSVNKANAFTYATLNGSVKVKAESAVASGAGLYKVLSYDKDGYATIEKITDTHNEYKVVGPVTASAIKYTDPLLETGSANLNAATDAVVYIISATGVVTTTDLAGLDAVTDNGTMSVVFNTKTDLVVKTIYYAL